jgi:hypothetical protein
VPAKNGRFTRQEETFVSVMAKTGDKASAMRAAAYKSPGAGNALMTRPAVQAAIRDAALAELHNDLLPLANVVLRMALDGSVVVPWGAKMKAVEIVHKRVFGEQEAGSGKTPAEMSPDELSAALDRLKRELSERSTIVLEHQAEAPETGVFD